MLDGASRENSTFNHVTINVYNCPSDGNVGHASYACTNYPENLGTNWANINLRNNGPGWFIGPTSNNNCSGTAVANAFSSPVTLAGISDGTTNTVMFSEMVKGTGSLDRDGLHMIYSGGPNSQCKYFGQANADFLMSQDCQQNAKTFNYAYKGKEWTRSYMGGGGGYTHTMPPNGKTCVYSSVSSQVFNLFAASSYHPGGVNCAMLDGSVKFIKNSIAYPAWFALGTRDGGEIISADAL